MPCKIVLISSNVSTKKQKTWDTEDMKMAVQVVREKSMGTLSERNSIKHPFGKTKAAENLLGHLSFAPKGLILLEAEYEKHNFPANRVFNVDETDLTVVENKVADVVVCSTNERLPSRIHISITLVGLRHSPSGSDISSTRSTVCIFECSSFRWTLQSYS
ncbi:uncharacterized protein LOC132700646 isoform X2 [Cylas formicarius]|uniref:uncharacterized protein LOC132700646 isoform X2 n=1 Tax=Cylas formicarius TaxID=197179 RepID=UPI002958BFAB|nr:uncharacterized protein LOC132700646 isoform X2 [Cylas formicarius]